MTLFEDDDAGYITWVRGNPTGHVLNVQEDTRSATETLVFHKASCRELLSWLDKRNLTGPNFRKLCDLDLLRLVSWARINRPFQGKWLHPIYCSRCRPDLIAAPALTETAVLAEDLIALSLTTSLNATTREALIEARLGQGGFREGVLSLWNDRCAVTGSHFVNAIRASHIRPWRLCSDEERLDPYNGLPLLASLDALFDGGFISFSPEGDMLISDRLPGTTHE